MHKLGRYALGLSGFALVASTGVYALQRRQQSNNAAPATKDTKMVIKHSFQTVFAVPMHCESCVKDVSGSVGKLAGISRVEADLKTQLVSIEGTAAPSAIVQAIEATGRDAILRGSGDSNSAAVSILETFYRPGENAGTVAASIQEDDNNREVRGLARMVQVSPNVTLVDLTLKGVASGIYRASIRDFGDLKDGASSTGPVWTGASTGAPKDDRDGTPRGFLGTVEVKNGKGSIYLDKPFQVWEVIGHALVVSPQEETQGAPLQNDENTVVGVIARSAGVWDNDKTVCSCTGKTLWEERKDEVQKGML